MRAESTIKPKKFEIEEKANNEYVTIKFFTDIESKELVDEEGNKETLYEYDEFTLKHIKNREGLRNQIESNYKEWLNIAVGESNKPEPETEKEKLIRVEKERKEVDQSVTDAELTGIRNEQDITDMDLRLLILEK